MCGFAGFAGFEESLWEERYLWGSLGKRMGKRLAHRGPDENGTHVSENCVLSHSGLSVSDLLFGKQPLTAVSNGFDYTITYDGSIYNKAEVKTRLEAAGYHFETNCDAELVLKAYMEFGDNTPEYLCGVFAFAVDDRCRKRLFLCRDRFGAKPLFYTFSGDRIVFGSEIKALFEYPGVKAVLGKTGLCEIWGLAPVRSPGSGVFQNVYELRPGCIATYSREGFYSQNYYALKSYEPGLSYEQTVEALREMLHSTVAEQTLLNVPVCALLSGGISSGIVTALAADSLKERDRSLHAYSFLLEEDRSFFAPDDDDALLSDYLDVERTVLNCSNNALFYHLYDSVIAADLPGTADVDSSLLYYCREIKKNYPIALCGAGANELFGKLPGMPEAYPWTRDLRFRNALIKPELAEALEIENYVNQKYEETLWDAPLISGEPAQMSRHRQMRYLNLRWFLQSLFNRLDRCGMYSGLEIRSPFMEHRLIELLYNTPIEYETKNGLEKSLLRSAAEGLLPSHILHREKSPCPKLHSPQYEEMLRTKLSYILRDSLQPIHKLISAQQATQLLTENFEYGNPPFGQTVAGPQLLANLIQINYWMLRYNIYVDL